MKKFIKPAYLLFYVLALVSFFVWGLLYADWIGAGENQGLAGGAIILGYGVISAFLGLAISFFVAYRLKHRFIIKINIVLLVLLLTSISLVFYNAERVKGMVQRASLGNNQHSKIL